MADAATVARFQQAIGECRARWEDRWDRAPTINELVRAWEIVLSSRPEDCVSDPDTVDAILDPPSAPGRPPLDPADFEVRIGAKSSFPGCDEAVVFFRETGDPRPAMGELRVLIERDGDVLIVDYWTRDYGLSPTQVEARDILMQRVVPFAIRRKALEIATIVLRPMNALDDPVTLPWEARTLR